MYRLTRDEKFNITGAQWLFPQSCAHSIQGCCKKYVFESCKLRNKPGIHNPEKASGKPRRKNNISFLFLIFLCVDPCIFCISLRYAIETCSSISGLKRSQAQGPNISALNLGAGVHTRKNNEKQWKHRKSTKHKEKQRNIKENMSPKKYVKNLSQIFHKYPKHLPTISPKSSKDLLNISQT